MSLSNGGSCSSPSPPHEHEKRARARKQALIDLNNEACYGQIMGERKRLFLRVGEEVSHNHYGQWGIGTVEEVMTSTVPGGTCLVRIRFQDGRLRVFNNDLDSEGCCYYFGMRRYWDSKDSANRLRARLFSSLKG